MFHELTPRERGGVREKEGVISMGPRDGGDVGVWTSTSVRISRR